MEGGSDAVRYGLVVIRYWYSVTNTNAPDGLSFC
jgi:hypothetical protein